VRVAWYILDKYFLLYDKVPAYLGALLLHPNRRLHYIKRNWELDWVKNLEPKVKAFWREHYKDKVLVNQEEPEVDNDDETAMEDSFSRWNREQESLSVPKDEYASFISSGCCAVVGPAYKWWMQPEVQKTYPNLSRMAIDLLSIPSMSAEPERVFSGARRTISWERMRLGSKTIEHNECLKSFVRIRVKHEDGYIHELRELTARLCAQPLDEREGTVDSEVSGNSEIIS